VNGAYLDLIATTGKTTITHIALFDGAVELSGGAPAYARKAVTWTGPTAGNGLIRPSVDLDFDVPAGATVDGWRGFTAPTGGTDYGGAALTPEVYAGQGIYRLLAASSGIDHDAA